MRFFEKTLFLSIAIASCEPHAEDRYTTKYDNVDVDEILHSDRLMKFYMNCMLDKGACTPVGQEVKERLPDALASGCEKCSEQQKKIIIKSLKFLIEHRRNDFDQLEARFDPKHIFRTRYQAQLEKNGIKL
ncbi:ejaculatory bulb-specific protein 3-like [Dendroctonus ponderosae]|nr:ejaculatory bulb-specific protein 3-like [Dendroctonus ponderosae]KAH1014745.1 hypothetical protein HUJ05_012577 [Dendroctonus ponderosae]